MAFFKRKDLNKDNEEGRVYLLRFYIDNKIYHKIGITFSDRVEDRMMEILLSFFKVYRYIPKTVLKKSIKTKVPRTFEKHMHWVLREYAHTFDKKFNGYTEFFTDLDEEVLIDYMNTLDYMTMLEGIDRLPQQEYDYIKEQLNKDNLDLLDAKIPF